MTDEQEMRLLAAVWLVGAFGADWLPLKVGCLALFALNTFGVLSIERRNRWASRQTEMPK